MLWSNVKDDRRPEKETHHETKKTNSYGNNDWLKAWRVTHNSDAITRIFMFLKPLSYI